MRYLGLVILIYGLIWIAGLLWVGVLLAGCYLKWKKDEMDEEKWNLYFKSMSSSSCLIKFWISYSISLIGVSIVGYFIFKGLHFTSPIMLSFLTVILGSIRISYKIKKYKSKLIEKISNKFNGKRVDR